MILLSNFEVVHFHFTDIVLLRTNLLLLKIKFIYFHKGFLCLYFEILNYNALQETCHPPNFNYYYFYYYFSLHLFSYYDFFHIFINFNLIYTDHLNFMNNFKYSRILCTALDKLFFLPLLMLKLYSEFYYNLI